MTNQNYEETNRTTYDNISKEWDSKRSYSWEPIKTFLENIKNKNSKILDLGCGTGRHLVLAEKYGFKKENLIGSDFSKKILKITEEKGYKTILCRMQDLDIKNEELNNVMCIAAIIHILKIEEQKKSLEEIYRILKNDGEAIISLWIPQPEYLEKEIKKGKIKYTDDSNKIARITYTYQLKRHDRFYYMFTEEEFTKLCNEVGFTIKKIEQEKGNVFVTCVKE